MRKNKYDELEVDENQFTAEITITRESYYNGDWGVYQFETSTPLPKIDPEILMGGDVIYKSVLTGNVQRLDIWQTYNATLVLDFNNKFKKWQFKPIMVNPSVPTSIENQQKFLCSVITTRQASTLLEYYPNIVQDVIDGKEDIDFSKLKGITPNNWLSIKNKIVDNFIIADVLSLLSPLGVSYNMIKKLIEFEGNPHLLKQKLNENPYILTQIKGLGFKKVDKLALQLNPDFLKSKMRAIAYMKYYLDNIGNDEGHTWVQNGMLKENFINNVPECIEYYDEIIRQEYRNSMFLKVNEDLSEIGLKKNYDYEEYIAYKLARNNQFGVKEISEDIIQRGIDKANEFQGFVFDDEQVEIIHNIVNGSGVQILTGNAGASKTSISRGILNVFNEAGMSINTCALSARAAIVVRENTGFPSSTIHRLLGYGFGGFFYNQNNYLMTDVLMLDEASMVNISLFKSIVEAVPETTKILIVGDGGQLPSIGCGNVLNDLVAKNDSRICSINFLKKIYRQAMKSAIITDANMIRENKTPVSTFQKRIVHGELKDMFYTFFDNKDDVYKSALSLYFKSIKSSGIDNVMIVCPRRENALNSARTFNVEIQEYLLGNEKEEIKYGDLIYKKGCKVMQIENNYDKDIFNGEIGYIVECNEKNIVVKFDKREIKYSKNELNQIDYAYAMTVHKCITGDTLLYTDKGIQSIKDLDNGAKVGEFKKITQNIKVFNGKYLEKPVYFYNNGIDKCYNITTKYGYHLSLTDEHNCYVLDSTGDIVKKLGKDLCENDWVLLSKQSDIYGNETHIPEEWLDNKLDVRTNTNYSLPTEMTEEFALFLGMMVADGTLFKRNKGLRYAKRHIENVELFKELCYKLFGHKKEITKTYNSKAYQYEIASSYICSFLNHIDGIKPNDKYVPRCIMEANKKIQCAFLRGLFEDGTVNMKKDHVDHVELSLKEEKVINQVHIMLLNMGIISSKKTKISASAKKEKLLQNVLYIYGTSITKFIDLIGFINELKKNRLIDYKAKRDYQNYPFIYEKIKKICCKYTDLRCFVMGCKTANNGITSFMLNKLIEIIEKSSYEDIKYDKDYLEIKYLYEHYVPQQIKSITTSIEQTYCLTMKETHTFVQNGMYMGNCQGGSYKNVIIVLDKSHFVMLNSSLLYTAITRASKKCCIFAEPFAFKKAVETSAIINRHTYLPLIDVDKESNCLTKYKKVDIEKEDVILPKSDELPF